MDKEKRNSMLATGLTILVLVSGAIWWFTGRDISPVGPVTIETKEVKESSSEENYTIDVKYPAVSTGNDLRDHRINSNIEKEIESIISGFKKDKAEFESLIDDQQENPILVTAPYSLSVIFETSKNTKGIFGAVFYVSSYMAGAAHPNNYLTTLNYDLETSSSIGIGDLFVTNSDYLTTLSELSREILYKKLEKELPYIKEQIDAGTKAQKINYESFLVTPEGLKILFNPYQIGPYALGTIDITIPWEDLADITNR